MSLAAGVILIFKPARSSVLPSPEEASTRLPRRQQQQLCAGLRANRLQNPGSLCSRLLSSAPAAMSLLLEAVGFFLSTVGWALLAVTLFNSYWRVSSVSGNVITTSTIFENLWQSCATDSTGVYNCWEFQSLLELPAYLQASRALMITALVLGFLAIVSSMVGLQCTKVGENNPDAKAKMAVVGGSLFILAGLCGMVTVSWYAFNITRDFFNPLFVGTKYEIGPALYLGWSASLLVIIGGCFLFSSCWTSSSQDHSYTYPYKAPKSGMPVANPSVSRPRRDSNASSNGQYGKNAYV